MSKSLLESINELFRPELPHWACEFTLRHVIVAGVDSKRSRVAGKGMVDAPGGAVAGSLSQQNLNDETLVLGAVRSALSQAGIKGSEIGVVIPDDSSRISLLSAENIPSTYEERETFVRWKLKKSLPFDVDTAQVAFKAIGSQELLVALSPRTIIDEYVTLMESAGMHAGYVIPSTLAALNLLPAPSEDTLFVKIAPGCITTTIYKDRRLQFYRRVAEMPIYDAVYPTVMYYQDKLAGAGIERVVVCGYIGEGRMIIPELQDRLNVPVQTLEPRNVDDIFKPSLGAVGLAWSNLI